MKIKYTLLAIAITILCSSVQAQIRKGTHLIGGSLGFGTSKISNESGPNSPDAKGKRIFLSPGWGIAIQDNLIIGADVTFGQITTEQGNTEQKTNNYGGGIFVRKYWEVLPRLYAFGQARAGYFSARYNFKTTPVWKKEQAIYNLNVVPGISYAAGKRVHLEAIFVPLLNFQYEKVVDYDLSDRKINENKTLALNSSLNNAGTLSLGIRILLGNK